MIRNTYRKQIIEEHRKMWNWIAGQYEKNRNSGIGVLKREYIKEHTDIGHILYGCFLCDYSSDVMMTKQIGMFRNSAERCKYCPVIWVSDEDDKEAIRFKRCPCESAGSPYYGVKRAINLEIKSKFAKEIAELPEKKQIDTEVKKRNAGNHKQQRSKPGGTEVP